MFFIKSLCVFFISVLIGFVICTAEKKTFYYYNSEKQKTEITKSEYFDIGSGNKNSEGKDATNLSKEDIYVYKNALIYGTTSFLMLMAMVSLFELWKRKKSIT